MDGTGDWMVQGDFLECVLSERRWTGRTMLVVVAAPAAGAWARWRMDLHPLLQRRRGGMRSGWTEVGTGIFIFNWMSSLDEEGPRAGSGMVCARGSSEYTTIVGVPGCPLLGWEGAAKRQKCRIQWFQLLVLGLGGRCGPMIFSRWWAGLVPTSWITWPLSSADVAVFIRMLYLAIQKR